MAMLSNTSNFVDTYDHAYETREIKRGEIYYVDLNDVDYTNTHVVGKTRPALVISNNIGNLRSDTVIVALLTTQRKKDYKFQYTFMLNSRESVVMCEQLMTLDDCRLKEKIGELTYDQMKELEKALMYELQLNKLSLENIVNFDIISLTTRKTRIEEQTYFEAQIEYEGHQIQTVNISLDKLQKFDSKINKDMEFTDIKKKLDCCAGLHWLVTNNEI